MTDVLKHRFVSPKLDGVDTQQVQPSHWNDGHKFQGGNSGEVLTRDPSDLTFGAKWTPIAIPPAVQEVPGGGVNGDVLTRDLTVPTFGSRWAPATTTIVNGDTGTQNNWTPAGLGSKDTVIYWNAATPLTITGIRGGIDGQIVTIKNRSSGGAVLSLIYFSASSLVENRLMTFVTSGPTPIGYEGFVNLVWSSAVGSWFIVGHEQGKWIVPPFVQSDYAGIWAPLTAGQITHAAYKVTGRTLHWSVYVSAVAGGPATIAQRKHFGGYTPGYSTAYHPGVCNFTDGTGPGAGFYQHSPATIDFYRSNAGIPFVAGTFSLNAAGTVEIA